MLTNGELGPYDELRRELARALWNVGAVLTQDMRHPLVVQRGSERGFVLPEHEKDASLPLAPYLFDFRTKDDPRPGLLTQEVVRLAVRTMYDSARRQRLHYDGIAGCPDTGVSLVNAYHKLHARFPIVCLDQQTNEDGSRSKIKVCGGTPRVRDVLLLDGMIMRADSKFAAIDALEGWGFRARNVLVLVDCEQGAAVDLAGKGYALWPVFTASELFRFYVEEKRVSETLFETVRGYRHRLASRAGEAAETARAPAMS
jgi:orotate phosphoribosyltransferase